LKEEEEEEGENEEEGEVASEEGEVASEEEGEVASEEEGEVASAALYIACHICSRGVEVVSLSTLLLNLPSSPSLPRFRCICRCLGIVDLA
jgi:hypothetical protein